MRYNKIESVEKLKEMSCPDALDVFIFLGGGFRSSKRISYNHDSDSWWLLNEIDDTESEYDSTEEFKMDYPLFFEAIERGCLYEY